MKAKISTLILLTFLFSCGGSEGSDIQEYIFADVNQDTQLRLFNHGKFLEFGAADCDFLHHLKEYEKPYADLMSQLKKKSWQYDFISVEYFDECLNDSIFEDFQQLNQRVFGKKLKSVKREDYIIVIELHAL